MVESRLAFDRDLREYNAANGITEGFIAVVANPRKRTELRNRGKDLNDEMAKAAGSSSSRSVSRRSGIGKTVYSSPAKNLRAAAAAKAELSTLTGDAWCKQAERVNELVEICNRLNEAYRKANPDGAAPGLWFQLRRSAGGPGAKPHHLMLRLTRPRA